MKSLRCFRSAVIIAALGGFASLGLNPDTAVAQEAAAAEDWEILRSPDQRSIAAVATFDNGISLAARCSKTVFDLMLTGLPEAPGREVARDLIFVMDHETDEKPYSWTIGRDRTVAFSRLPALIARQLAKGGDLQIIVPATPSSRRTRYVMELSPSGSAIEETLAACGRPLVDPRDAQLEGDGHRMPEGVVWARIPQAQFPSLAAGVSFGYATLSCMIGPQGRPEDCQIESEQPASLDFGRSALQAAPRARLAQTEEARTAGRPFEGELIVFTTEFHLR